MTKEFNVASGKFYDSEVLEMLENSVKIKMEFHQRAKLYFNETKIQLSRSIKRRDKYLKTGRLPPEVTKKD